MAVQMITVRQGDPIGHVATGSGRRDSCAGNGDRAGELCHDCLL
jgi:hypothetical protein